VTEVVEQASRRRTIAVISHPDAGKSTLSEALLLHANKISSAGAVHGKGGRAATVTDWMEMEKARGISITSAAVQFEHEGAVINLVDTPGHSDFSEDTYRVLSAVDSAVMLIDAAKGLEAQTMKLFDVCRRRGIPIITVINKWDRPGRDALDLMDELRDRTGLVPQPVTWPVGLSGIFHGLLDVSAGHMERYHRTPGGATIAGVDILPPAEAEAEFGDDWATALDEAGLVSADATDSPDARLTPVLFGAAVLNIGVRHLLDLIVSVAPPAVERVDERGDERSLDAPFSAYVFKVQSGMDPAHRDRVAFARICSGRFERGMIVTHAQSGRPFATRYAQQVFGQDRSTLEEAWPGDIVGLVNAASLRPGHTLFDEKPVTYPAIEPFAPEHFRIARSTEANRYKQFRRGIEQLDEEGVVQVLRSERRGDREPILGAVGPMQFEVVADRMEREFRVPIAWDTLPYSIARVTNRESAEVLSRKRECEIVERSDGSLLALFSNEWRLLILQRENPELMLEAPTGAGADAAPVSLPHTS